MLENKNRGFTLIELLAVIIILAILAVIAIPSITKIMKNSKKSAFLDSAYGLVSAAKYFQIDDSQDKYVFSFEDGKRGETEHGEKLSFSGSSPTEGKLTIYDYDRIDLNVCNNEYCACKGAGNDTIFIVEKSIEICGVNDDGTTSDNPVMSNKLVLLEEELNKLSDELDSIQEGIIDKTYPVGSIYISVSDANPETLFGGTWVSYGEGRTLVGLDTEQTEFDTVEKQGGEKVHTLTIPEIPSHTHTISIVPGSVGIDPGPNNSYYLTGVTTAASGPFTTAVPDSLTESKLLGADYVGGAQAHNNLQPYITVYMWKRVS